MERNKYTTVSKFFVWRDLFPLCNSATPIFMETSSMVDWVSCTWVTDDLRRAWVQLPRHSYVINQATEQTPAMGERELPQELLRLKWWNPCRAY